MVPSPASSTDLRAVDSPPVHVHLHGGAFIMRHPRMDDFWARYLVATAGVAVVSVDYATAPQSRYPVAQEQSHDVLAHLADHGSDLGLDGARLGVGGFSAGGNLAASACLQARDRGTVAPRFQLLGVPSLDLTQTWAEKRPVGGPCSGRASWTWSGLRTSATPSAGPSRTPRPRAPRRSPDSRRRWWSPPSATCCVARATRTPTDSPPTGCPWSTWSSRAHDHYFLDRHNAPALMSRMAAAVRHSLTE